MVLSIRVLTFRADVETTIVVGEDIDQTGPEYPIFLLDGETTLPVLKSYTSAVKLSMPELQMSQAFAPVQLEKCMPEEIADMWY